MVGRNVEIKARVGTRERFDNIFDVAQNLHDGAAATLVQQDTFFECKLGRLKLRVLGENDGQLICYNRPDVAGPKLSSSDIFETKEPAKLKLVLESALGSIGTVQKLRRLFVIGQTRVHLDEVEDLGYFVELEVVLCAEQTQQEGQTIARELATKLGLTEADFVEVAYVDLLREKNTFKRPPTPLPQADGANKKQCSAAPLVAASTTATVVCPCHCHIASGLPNVCCVDCEILDHA